MNFKNIILIIFISIFSSCQEESLSDKSVVDSSQTNIKFTELDNWINLNITKPYNISVNYRWNKNNSISGVYNSPPKIEKVKPVLEAIKDLALKLYQKKGLGGVDFWKGKAPIKIHLFGRKNVDNNNFENIANTDSVGRELYIYDVDTFDSKNKDKVYILMRSVHHQLAKLFAEFNNYDRDTFIKISEDDYITSTERISLLMRTLFDVDSQIKLYSIYNKRVNQRGFFSVHSILSAEDEFAELISIYLTTRPIVVENAKQTIKVPVYDPNPQIQQENNTKAKRLYQNILTKQKFVEDYYEENFGFTLKRAQLYSLQEINTFLNK